MRVFSSSQGVWLTSVVLALWGAACGKSPEPHEDAAPTLVQTAQGVTPGFNPLPQGFDWSMSKRFPVDSDGDGVREERFDWDYRNPTEFAVTFNGCPADVASTPDYTFEWRLGQIEWLMGTSCSHVQLFGQGSFDVTLRIRKGTQLAEYKQKVVVKDHLIVSLGDSYGAGEGAPDVAMAGSQPARWANERCHRSFNSPSARAALALEEADPHSSVTYLSLACSGATISRETYKGFAPTDAFVKAGTCGSLFPCERYGSGFLGGYVGIQEPPLPWESWDYLPPQVEQLKALVGNRPIDALIISGGGNDIGFADILKYCVTQPLECHATTGLFPPGPKLHAEVDPLLGALPGRYDALAARLAQLGVNVRNTYLMEYPDFTRDDSGVVCDKVLGTASEQFLGYVSRAELQHLQGYVQTPLQDMMRAAAARHGWSYVSGISARFAGQDGSWVGHGMCASPWNRWMNTVDDAVVIQGPNALTTTGKAHPNSRGYQVMAEQLLRSLWATQPALRPNRTLLRAHNTYEVYAVFGGVKWWVPSWELLWSYYPDLGEEDVQQVSQSMLNALPDNALPDGYLDGAHVSAIWGWVWDGNQPASSIPVDLSFDGPYETASSTVRVLADRHRPDLCPALGSCYHGFSTPVPPQYCNGQPRTVYAYGVDLNGGWRQPLGGTPKTFVCHQPRGYFDLASGAVIEGWSQDLDTPQTPTQVELFFDGPAGSGAQSIRFLADRYRSDLCTALGSCTQAFSVRPPPQFCDGRPHTVYPYAVDTTNGHLKSLSGGIKSFTCSLPIGHLDLVNGALIEGWSQDPDAPQTPTQVELFFDGPAGSGAQSIRFLADLYRSDLCTGIGSCKQAFSVRPPPQFCDGKPHTVYPYGVDTANGHLKQLSGGTKSFTCP
jgi:lysophospholipase L1-like esterase